MSTVPSLCRLMNMFRGRTNASRGNPQQELIFADHVHPLAAGQDIFGDSLDGPMVLLHDVVQLFDLIFF